MQHDGGYRCLSPLVRVDPEHRGFEYLFMGRGDFLDVLRIDVDATGDDQLFFAARQVQKAAFIEVPEIAAEEPAVAEGFARKLGLFVVAGR